MDSQTLTPYKVTLHAIEQFISRGAKDRPHDKTAARILRNIGKAKEVVKKDATLNLLNNGGKEARYFHKHPFIYVVVDGAVVTCIRNPMMRHYSPIKDDHQ
jgi:hypothetical protein